MSKIKEKIELITNVAIIFVSILFLAIVIQKYFFTPVSNLPELNVGTKIDLPNVTWNEHKKNLIFALRKGCHFCEESADFYKKLIPIANEKGTRIIAVLPTEVEESREYLNKLGLPLIETKQAELDSINVVGTPFLILTNEQGEVIQSWAGKLSSEQEKQVLESLQ